MANYLTTDTELTGIANAIRSASGTSEPISFPSGFATAIGGILGAATADANATSAHILSGKTAYVNGNKVTGSIATKAASDVTISGNNVSIPSGYYASTVSKAVGTSKSAQTYTPGTTDQTISSGQYLAGAQTIKGDANLVASKIKSGVSIFGVTGTYQSTPTMNTVTTTDSGSYAIQGYGSLSGLLCTLTPPSPGAILVAITYEGSRFTGTRNGNELYYGSSEDPTLVSFNPTTYEVHGELISSSGSNGLSGSGYKSLTITNITATWKVPAVTV